MSNQYRGRHLESPGGGQRIRSTPPQPFNRRPDGCLPADALSDSLIQRAGDINTSAAQPEAEQHARGLSLGGILRLAKVVLEHVPKTVPPPFPGRFF